jgi:hypothetical protein
MGELVQNYGVDILARHAPGVLPLQASWRNFFQCHSNQVCNVLNVLKKVDTI